MPEQHRTALAALAPSTTTFASAIRRTFRVGYSLRDLRGDVLAGIVVAVVALPLSMALAIASGVPPQHGIYTAIVAGALTALLGGSSVQVTGPTAAFVVVLAPISAKFGLGGLLLATIMAGGLLVAAGLAKFGRLIEFIPYPVTTGFTSGIAVVIATLQIKDFFGLNIAEMPESYIGKVQAIVAAAPTFHIPDVAIGLGSLGVLFLLPKFTKVIPSPLIALPAAGIIAYLMGLDVATINSRFTITLGGVTHHGIPQLPPMPMLPWAVPGPDGQQLVLSVDLIRSLIGSAFAIAMLGAIESLLSAVVSDGMTGLRHDPDAELIGQGVGNIVAPFFGGFAATGAIARTAMNIRCGARSPFAAVSHALFILAAVLLVAPLLGYLPMASMAALLLMVAWNMSELKHFFYVLRTGPRGDVFVLLVCFLLTVIFDMVVSVSVGVVLAAILFMRRMADVSSVNLVAASSEQAEIHLPPSAIVYQIGGPLFFGAAQKAMSALRTVQRGIGTVILDLTAVPIIDATGLVNLESSIERLRKSEIYVIIAGVQPELLRAIARAGWEKQHRAWLTVRRSLSDATALAWARHSEFQPSPADKPDGQ